MKQKSTKSRLIELREILNLSQNDFSATIGVTQGALSQLESGKSKLSLDTLQKICGSFDANCNWLVNGTGNIFISKNPDNHYSEKFGTSEDLRIPLIREEAHAGYINNHQDSAYLKTLDTYKIPGYENGNYRLFEIEGDSMSPTLHSRDIVVTELNDDWNAIGNGNMCVVITCDGIVAKRVYLIKNDSNHIVLKSDNPNYKTYTIAIKDVKEIWEIKSKITSVFTEQPENNFEKIKILESDIETLKKQMKTIIP